jgi:hypothetical protein
MEYNFRLKRENTHAPAAAACAAGSIFFIFALWREQPQGQGGSDDEGAHVGCQSDPRPRDTLLGLILFLVPTLLPIP